MRKNSEKEKAWRHPLALGVGVSLLLHLALAATAGAFLLREKARPFRTELDLRLETTPTVAPPVSPPPATSAATDSPPPLPLDKPPAPMTLPQKKNPEPLKKASPPKKPPLPSPLPSPPSESGSREPLPPEKKVLISKNKPPKEAETSATAKEVGSNESAPPAKAGEEVAANSGAQTGAQEKTGGKEQGNQGENTQTGSAPEPSLQAKNALAQYAREITARINRAKRYPAEARERGEEGAVKVRFMVHAGGDLSDLQVVKSSGSALLDQAALTAVEKAAPFPPLPPELGKPSQVFTVTIKFSLK